ncbi:MAG: hypothetical protein ACJ8AD_07535, partial [Gemmatimonadaceae bacterium]
MLVFCAIPVTAQGVVQAGDTVPRGEQPRLVAGPLPTTVASFIEAQRSLGMVKHAEPARPFSAWSASVHGLRDS